MCRLTEKVSIETFTGYKYVLVNKKTGKIYSPATGIEYKVGKVAKPRVRKIRLDSYFVEPRKMITKHGVAYEVNMVGRTGVFAEPSNARDILVQHGGGAVQDYRPSIAKITISDDIMRGIYDNGAVYAGKHIDSIELIELIVTSTPF